MAAPNPMGIAECAPTVKEVMRDLAKGKGLPTCALVSGTNTSAGRSYVTYRRAPMTPSCPDGTTQGTNGIVYHQGRMPDNLPKANPFSTRRTSISGGAEIETTLFEVSKRVCIAGNHNGTYTASGWWDGGRKEGFYNEGKTHEWYDQVVVMTPDGADYEFDVTIDDKPFTRHRFSL